MGVNFSIPTPRRKGNGGLNTRKGSDGSAHSTNSSGSRGRGNVNVLQGAHQVQTTGGTWSIAAGDIVTNVTNVSHVHFHTAIGPAWSTVEEFAVVGNWLTMLNFQVMQVDTLRKRVPNTCSWILDYQQFQRWLVEGGILWGTGIPGAGKTILASIVIDYLHSIANEDANVCVAFAYCRYTEPITIEDILSALVKQLLERHPKKVSVFVKPMYDRHQRTGTRPTQEELLELLEQISSSNVFSAMFFAIDGLDEASSDTQVDILSSLSSFNIRFFITSRPLDTLKELVPTAVFFDVALRDLDVVLLINQKMKRSPNLRKLLEIDGWKESLVSNILRRSSGMFLLACLQLESLRDCLTINDLRESLERLPDGMEDMYGETIRRIELQPRRHVELAKRALTWLLYSHRSLSMEELQYAVSICPKSYEYDPERIVHKDALISLCCGLVTVNEDNQSVRLVHYTAKDCLRVTLLKDDPNPHALIACTCAALLLQYGFHDQKILYTDELEIAFKAHPLLEYSYDNWVSHMQASDPVPPKIIHFVQKCRRYPYPVPSGFALDHLGYIHVAAMYNIPSILSNSLEDTIDINAKSRLGSTALALAATQGHEEIVKLLLGRDEIAVNAVDQEGMTALMRASSAGEEGIVRALLGVPGIDANTADLEGWTCTMYAACGGHTGVVKALLDVDGIDLGSVSSAGWTALMCAAYFGCEGVVETLVEVDACDVGARDLRGRTALALAMDGGHESVADLLRVWTPQLDSDISQHSPLHSRNDDDDFDF
ncbi:ankyrin [Coprinopsis marcescibilis]|uniref:Ankyrin n=1 Tax=Coprinopsis marcescibilis TaxID=230819 RepID=A0A5C3L9D1_COPMA|nr:ankyrin [Coprinopsis marcescibilis]